MKKINKNFRQKKNKRKEDFPQRVLKLNSKNPKKFLSHKKKYNLNQSRSRTKAFHNFFFQAFMKKSKSQHH